MKRLLVFIVPRILGAYFNVVALFSTNKAGVLAMHTFAKVRRSQLRNGKKIPLLEQAKRESIEVSSMHIQTYHWPGEKESVLLLHGWESNTNRWRNLIQVMRKEGFNIYAIDAPAHGNSTGTYHLLPDYVEAAYQMIKKYSIRHLIGHSMGGMAIFYLLYKHQNTSVRSFVTLGAPADFSLIVSGYQRRVPFNRRVYRALDAQMKKLVDMDIYSFSSIHFAKHITQKALIMHDRNDQTIPYNQSLVAHNAMANSELVLTEKNGHSMHQAEVCEKILLFLSSN
jgi:pimeloyl-ACP methyl ester carboxylesterase